MGSQEQLNLGVDVGLWRDRINLVVDVYDKTSKDMLMDLQLPSYWEPGQPVLCTCTTQRKLWYHQQGDRDFLNTRNMVGAFEWNTNIQWSANKNTLEALMERPMPL